MISEASTGLDGKVNFGTDALPTLREADLFSASLLFIPDSQVPLSYYVPPNVYIYIYLYMHIQYIASAQFEDGGARLSCR